VSSSPPRPSSMRVPLRTRVTESTEDSVRRPYVKPFLRNLDAADTEGKAIMDFENSTFHSEGPS
jgi:hypothetical protein